MLIDDITALPCRKAFFKELESIKERPAIVAIFDIDDFKYVNFSNGYRAGDLILKAVGNHIKKKLSTYFKEASLYRTGANQFTALILDDVPLIRLKELFVRHVGLIEIKLKDEVVRLTISAGVSQGVGGSCSLFAQAEDALFSAKSRGKNTIVFYETFSLRDTERFRQVRQKLIEAIRQKSIKPYFQPIVSLRTGRVYGYEVLSRIFYKDEMLSGDYVFAVADALALTPEIDKILFLNAMEYRGDYKLFFNLSMKYFFRELNAVLAIAKDYSLDFSNVIFEITESQKLMEEDVAVSIFRLFKELNAGIAIDDFGAGYSNFMYIKKFPVDVVKIEGTFVRGSKEELRDLAIVKAIVDVAKAFRLRTLAEFIEDEETFRLMRDVGVSLGQGYFIGRPMPQPEEVFVEVS